MTRPKSIGGGFGDKSFLAFRSTAKGDVFVDFSQWPTSLRMRINEAKMERNVGNRLATLIKKRLRAGLDGDGQAIPTAKTASNPAINRTGELIKSIRYKDGWVAPGWSKYRPEKGPGMNVRTNFGLMIVLLSGLNVNRAKRYTRKDGEPRQPMPKYGDLMGAESPKQQEQLMDLARREIKRQLDSGEIGIIAELRGVAKQAKRGRR